MSFIGVRFEVGEGVKLTVYFAKIQHFFGKNNTFTEGRGRRFKIHLQNTCCQKLYIIRTKKLQKNINYCIFHGLSGKLRGNDQIWVKKLKILKLLVIWA